MNEPLRILVVEDEPAIADTIVYALKSEGFAPEWRSTSRDALAALAKTSFALVVLDVGLPDGTGFEICKKIRVSSAVPVLFLTARNTELDRVLGLELGGDDYLTKPFSPRELTARVKAILRRTNGGSTPATPNSNQASASAPAQTVAQPLGRKPAAAEGGGFVVDDEGCTISFRGMPLDLTRYEFRLLKILVARQGRVFSREQLMTAAWEDPGASLDRTVDAHIKTLRAKLRVVAPDTELIQTHRGFGYSLRAPE
jgi:two-component system, OmpR family, catabolic regulation response regulator CreB